MISKIKEKEKKLENKSPNPISKTKTKLIKPQTLSENKENLNPENNSGVAHTSKASSLPSSLSSTMSNSNKPPLKRQNVSSRYLNKKIF